VLKFLRNFKAPAAVLTLVLLALFYASFFSLGPAAANDDSTRTVRVGVYNNYPKIYRDSSGNIRGFWAEITNYIAGQENWKVVYIYGTFQQGLNRLSAGQIDMMVDVGVDPARQQAYDFNNVNVLAGWASIYEKPGERIGSLLELRNKKIAVMEGDIHYTGPSGIVASLKSLDIPATYLVVPSYSDVLQAVSTGKADAGVVNWLFGEASTGYKVAPTDVLFDPIDLRYALNRNSPETPQLISSIDYVLAPLKKNNQSFYYQALNGLLGKYTVVQRLPRWFVPTAAAAAVLLVIAAASIVLLRNYQRVLKREIDKGIKKFTDSEAKFSAVINQAQDGIAIIQDEKIIYANKAFKISGYSENELIGKDMSELISPDEYKRVRGFYQNRLSGKSAPPIYEMKLRQKNGSLNDVEISAGAISYSGKPSVLILVRDISERRHYMKKVEQLENAKTEFMSIAAHQLRAPLTSILTLSQVMRDYSGEKLTASQTAFVDKIIKGTLQMNELVDFLLRIARAEGGSMALSPAPVHLDQLAEDIISQLETTYKNKHIKINLNKKPEDLPAVWSDQNALAQVLLNLISNALEYSPDGSEITVSIEVGKRRVKCSVKDNGIGISKEDQVKLFDKFFRSEKAKEMSSSGAGLGLSLAKSIIQTLGGRIWVKSELNKGSTFYFTFPISSSQ
jgi:PAS domain S-box-containing protein